MQHLGSEYLQKACKECKKQCMAIPCSHNLKASEWYCSTCHKSYRMEIEAAEYLLDAEQNRRK